MKGTSSPIPRVVGITAGDHGRGRELISQVEGAAAGGLRMLVLREPKLAPGRVVALARRIAPLFAPGALVIHGKTPGAVALAGRAGWGLHVPSGTDLAGIRAQVRGALGISCHTLLDISVARRAGCDYVTLSPIWKPGSKPQDTRKPLGIRGLGDACLSAGMPVMALGGIRPDRVARCLSVGAHGVATMTGIFGPKATPEAAQAGAISLHRAVHAALQARFEPVDPTMSPNGDRLR